MIIHKETKSIESLDGKPDSNYGNYDNVFIVDDRSVLAEKLKENAPYFDFVLDAGGNLIDIVPIERPPEPILEPTQLDLLQEKYTTLQGAVDFIIMNF